MTKTLRYLFTCSDLEFTALFAEALEHHGAKSVDHGRLLEIVKVERMGMINWLRRAWINDPQAR